MARRLLMGMAWLALTVVLIGGAVYRTSVMLGPEETESGVTAEAGQAIRALRGTALAVDGEMLIVETEEGAQVIIEGQPWAYALARGFTCQPGEIVTVTGYPEQDEFKAMRLATASGAEIILRNADGRPAWAGQGRGH